MNRLLCGLLTCSLLVGLTGPAQAQYTFATLDVPGAQVTEAFGINQAGQIVGVYQLVVGGVLHGFLLDVDGTYTTIDVPGATFTLALGINDAGQIVGYYSNPAIHGFVLDVDGSYTTLDVPGGSGTQAYRINSLGQIVGQYAAGGRIHGFLATPGG